MIEGETPLTVSYLAIHPLKSGLPQSVDTVGVDEYGFVYDRECMVVEEETGKVITIHEPKGLKLEGISAEIAGGRMTLIVPEQEPLQVRLEDTGIYKDIFLKLMFRLSKPKKAIPIAEDCQSE